MKLNQIKTQCIGAATPDALTLAIAAWLRAAPPEATIVSIDFATAAGVYAVNIVYVT